jgi:hypothetical protein
MLFPIEGFICIIEVDPRYRFDATRVDTVVDGTATVEKFMIVSVFVDVFIEDKERFMAVIELTLTSCNPMGPPIVRFPCMMALVAEISR